MGQLKRCCVCGTPGAQQWACVNLAGQLLPDSPPTHDGNCRLFEHGLRLAGEYLAHVEQHGPRESLELAAWQLADVSWEMRRWVASLRRQHFAEPRPQQPSERRLRAALAAFETAREERASCA